MHGIVMLVCLLFISVSLISYESGSPNVCVEKSRVKSIDSITYRGGWVTMENGKRIDVGQPRNPIKVGDELCLKRERQLQ